MPSTWFLGDIHGCAEELQDLLQRLHLGPADRVIALGDLYHRGPDPHGVAQILAACPGFELVLGNHEYALLSRAGMLAPNPFDPVLPVPEGAGGYDAEDLCGDGGTQIQNIDTSRSVELLRLLERGRFLLRGTCALGPLASRPWLAVHAGIIPGKDPLASSPIDLIHVRRLGKRRNAPFWYERYRGPELVVFGHTTSPIPRRQEWGGILVAHGIDTGCVYGGSLSAWRIEDDSYEVIPARRAWVE